MKPLDCFDIYEDAEFYDQEFGTRSTETPFLLKQAKLAGGPVLEVACGTGRLTLPLARAGIEITGLDISQPMLDPVTVKLFCASSGCFEGRNAPAGTSGLTVLTIVLVTVRVCPR